ncbi:hypothetical protein NQ318_022509 [Aromia moschata]|uniref:Uncharacterized protein n=1 Tax=Aromia moschata TaxID=1265417 RepID=A0AAV8Z720_9CUCU|nr:hypothetical protein NQ318_022509 [Aromia moschata]
MFQIPFVVQQSDRNEVPVSENEETLRRVHFNFLPTYEVCKLSTEIGNVAPHLATLRILDLEGRSCTKLSWSPSSQTGLNTLDGNISWSGTQESGHYWDQLMS